MQLVHSKQGLLTDILVAKTVHLIVQLVAFQVVKLSWLLSVVIVSPVTCFSISWLFVDLSLSHSHVLQSSEFCFAINHIRRL